MYGEECIKVPVTIHFNLTDERNAEAVWEDHLSELVIEQAAGYPFSVESSAATWNGEGTELAVSFIIRCETVAQASDFIDAEVLPVITGFAIDVDMLDRPVGHVDREFGFHGREFTAQPRVTGARAGEPIEV